MKCVRLCDVPAGCCKKLCPSSKVIYYIDRDTYIWGKLCVNKCGSTIKIRNESRLKFYNDICGKERDLNILADSEFQGLDFYVNDLQLIEPNCNITSSKSDYSTYSSKKSNEFVTINGNYDRDDQFITGEIHIHRSIIQTNFTLENVLSVYNTSNAQFGNLYINDGSTESEDKKKLNLEEWSSSLKIENSSLNVSNIDIEYNGGSICKLVGPAVFSVRNQAKFINSLGALVDYTSANLGDEVEFQEGALIDINTKNRSIGPEFKTINAYSEDNIFNDEWPDTDKAPWIQIHLMAAHGNILVEEDITGCG